jgi:hypothetical protein
VIGIDPGRHICPMGMTTQKQIEASASCLPINFQCVCDNRIENPS